MGVVNASRMCCCPSNTADGLTASAIHIAARTSAETRERGVMSDLDQNQNALPEGGIVRLSAILAPKGPLPISRSSWWAGVASGRYPKPVKLGPRITGWRAEDIRKLIEQGVG
jgi:prophage regulatory protein